MFSFWSIVTAFALVAGANAAPTRRLGRRMVVHESRYSGIPMGFSSSGLPAVNSTINMRVALVAKGMKALEEKVYDVSTPGSASYGNYLTREEVQALAGPSVESVSAVTGWLSDNGITAQTSGAFDDWLTFSITVEQANKLLNANFQPFVHDATGETLIRTMSYSLPRNIQQHIDLVHPTTAFVVESPRTPESGPSFSFPAKVKRANNAPAECDQVGSPNCLQALYGIPAEPATQENNHIFVTGYNGQFAQEADLQAFLQSTRPDISSNTSFALETLDGGENPQGANFSGIEANLDVQYAMGVATGVPTTFLSVGPQIQDGVNGFLDTINFLNSKENPPQVLTTSYGFNEFVFPDALATRMCNAYMALGARGVSILFSTGNGGVSGTAGRSDQCSTFIPTFPSTCPFVTSVGSTRLIEEVAADFSSGGFSDKFTIPSYQADAVNGYLKTLGNINQGLFNTKGRGFPDVSTQGQNMTFFNAGQEGLVSGTSLSTPIFAGMIALINDRLLASGKKQLGFLNPLLYNNPGAFFDITSGNNPGCNSDGFPASNGWDPITGLGTPNFTALLTAVGL